MKNLIVIIFSLFAPFILTAQTTITWKGGTPGKETVWNEARNWDQHRLPNENDRVIIRTENNGHFAQPILNESAKVAWIEIYAGSSLTIAENSTLIIDGQYTHSEGISIFGGSLNVKGRIQIKDVDSQFIAHYNIDGLPNTTVFSSEMKNNRFSFAKYH